MSAAVVNVLKQKRGVDKPRDPTKRRKRITVLPGASISVENENSPIQMPSTSSADNPCSSVSASTSRSRKRKQATATNFSSDSESSIDVNYGLSSDDIDDNQLCGSDNDEDDKANDLPNQDYNIGDFVLIQFK